MHNLEVTFNRSTVAAMHRELHRGSGPGVQLIANCYYRTDDGSPQGKEMVLKQFPWLVNETDGVIAYFMNDKMVPTTTLTP